MESTKCTYHKKQIVAAFVYTLYRLLARLSYQAQPTRSGKVWVGRVIILPAAATVNMGQRAASYMRAEYAHYATYIKNAASVTQRVIN